MPIDVETVFPACCSKIDMTDAGQLSEALKYEDGRTWLAENFPVPDNIFGQINVFCSHGFDEKDPWTISLFKLFDRYDVPYAVYESLEDPHYKTRRAALDEFRKNVRCPELEDFYLVNATASDYSAVAISIFHSGKRKGLVTIKNTMAQAPRSALNEKLGFEAKTVQISNDLSKNSLSSTFAECLTHIANNARSFKQYYDHYSSAVFLLHGKGTFGAWVQKLKNRLEALGFYVESASFGFVNQGSFLKPGHYFLNEKIAQVKNEFVEFCRRSGSRRKFAIAHSFGSYLLGGALTDQPKSLEGGLIFCGSIARRDMEPTLSSATGDPRKIVNDVGWSDRWPAMATGKSVPYGQVGFEGFKKAGIHDRFHVGVDHSGFFSDDFMEKYWIPFLRSGDVVDGSADEMNKSGWRQLQSRVWLEAWQFLAYVLFFAASGLVGFLGSYFLGLIMSIVLGWITFGVLWWLFNRFL